jgi:hypothetical protein
MLVLISIDWWREDGMKMGRRCCGFCWRGPCWRAHTTTNTTNNKNNNNSTGNKTVLAVPRTPKTKQTRCDSVTDTPNSLGIHELGHHAAAGLEHVDVAGEVE